MIEFTCVENKSDIPVTDYRGIVAVDDAQRLIVLASTDDCRKCDMFINGYAPDYNCLECADSLDVGMYEMRFVSWSNETYDGDYDYGIDAIVIKKLSTIPEEFSLIKS